MHQLFVTVGILFSGLVVFILVQYVSRGWMGLLGFGLLPAAVQIAMQGRFPESPKWLIRQGRFDEAKAAIASLEAPGFDVDAAVDSIRIADEREAGISEATWS